MSTALYYLAALYIAQAYAIAAVASVMHLRRGSAPLVYAVWVVLVVAAPVSVPVALAVVAMDPRRAR